MLSVSYQVHFDVLRIVVLAILLEDRLRLLQRLQVVHPVTHSRACGIHSRTRYLACFYHVSVGKYVGSGGLWVTGSGHAISQVGSIDPNRVFMQAPSRPHVGVSIDKSWGNGLACSINHGSSSRIQGSGFSDGLDPVVFDQDVSLFDDLIAFHGDDSCIFNQNASFRRILCKEYLHLMLRWAVGFFLLEVCLVEAVCFGFLLVRFEKRFYSFLICFG